MIKKLKNEEGFTLIELIMVIVLLGILAAVAIPQFVSLQADAQNARAQGALAALRGTVTLLHARYLLDVTSTYNSATVLASTNFAGNTNSDSAAAAITVTWDDNIVDTFTYSAQSGFTPGSVS